MPETQSLRDVYVPEPDTQQSLEPEQQARWNNLVKEFKGRYSDAPGFVARSPGRVNIIGEHIDYSLYDVLPTALSVDVLVAVKTMPASGPEATIKVDNTDPRFAASEFVVSSDREVDIDASRPDWVNYFKAGLRVAVKYLREKDSAFVPVNIEALVDGNVPPGGGISSSAAFVCASALAVVKANGHNISKQELLDISIVSERAVGVYSGGCVYLYSPSQFVGMANGIAGWIRLLQSSRGEDIFSMSLSSQSSKCNMWPSPRPLLISLLWWLRALSHPTRPKLLPVTITFVWQNALLRLLFSLGNTISPFKRIAAH